MIATWMPRSWQALTREARDTLWLLGSLALVLAPHIPRLPWWASVCAALALLWRAQLAWRDAPLPSRRWLTLLLVALLAMTWLTYHTIIGREAGITLVVMLATLKSLELRARRDALVCLYLGFFLIFTQFMFSQGIGTALLMLLAVWALLSSLILGQRPLGRPPLKEVGAEALRAMLWGLPLMLVLFVLFPRLGPLWSLPSDAHSRTGLSDTLKLGQVAELAQDDTIALRLQFQGPGPLPEQMYFRGPTLDDFDGKTWTPAPPTSDDTALPPRFSGTAWHYTVTLEPSTLKIVPLLEGTQQAQSVQGTEQVMLTRQGLNWSRQGGDNQRLQLQALAHSQVRHGPIQAEAPLLRWLRLPRGFNPRTVHWAQQWRQQPPWQRASPRQLAAGVLSHIRQSDFRYTLAPGLPPDPASPHLIDDFWIDRQRGFCEHFSTAFVVTMRAMGVPARVVTGFQGAELNPVDGQYIVRNSQAHAWAEIWSPGEGWVRVDPTAAVAPERVERAPHMRALSGLPGPLGQLDPDALRRLRSVWEAVDHRWNVWVLQYSGDQQMKLMRALGWNQPDWEQLGQLLALSLSGLALGSTLVIWLSRDRPRRQPWLKPLRRVHQALSALSSPPEGPSPAAASAWRARLQTQWSGDSPESPLSRTQAALLQALNELDALRYGMPSDQGAHGADRQKRDQLVRQIELLSKSLVEHARAGGAHSPP
jgi:transglutaminase-like putative cysteine protease